MEKPVSEKLSILYIGNDNGVIGQIYSKPDIFDVSIVENGLAAIAFLEKNPKIDGIVSEDTLPGLNGVGLYNMIKVKHLDPNTPFIIFSHEYNTKLIKQALREKIDDLYTLPVSIDNLHIRITFLKEFKEHHMDVEKEKEEIKEYRITFIKRAFDILVSSFALLLLSPLFILVALAIKLESKGPIYYTSKRVGTGYRIFDFYKFRSMFTGADAKLKELEHLNKYATEKKLEEEKTEEGEKCPKCDRLPEDEYC